jgi:hypothetical protein
MRGKGREISTSLYASWNIDMQGEGVKTSIPNEYGLPNSGKAKPFSKPAGCIGCHGTRANNDFILVHEFK